MPYWSTHAKQNKKDKKKLFILFNFLTYQWTFYLFPFHLFFSSLFNLFLTFSFLDDFLPSFSNYIFFPDISIWKKRADTNQSCETVAVGPNNSTKIWRHFVSFILSRNKRGFFAIIRNRITLTVNWNIITQIIILSDFLYINIHEYV